MYFLQRRHSPHHLVQLLDPSFAYMLANPEERMKCGPTPSRQRCGPTPRQRCAQAKRAEVFSSSYIHVVEETDRFLLFTDLPGVKVRDLTVELTDNGVLRIHGERKKGEESFKFERQFLVDDQLIETPKITASLSDGTLEIVAPKKEVSKSRRVAVVAGAPTANDDDDDDEAFKFSFEVEVPGVNVNALLVEVKDDGKLVISGERKRGGHMTTVHKAFSLNKRIVDTDKPLEAFLQDGILTIRAPKKEPLVGRVIPVNSPNSKEESVEKEVEEKEEDAVDEEEKDVTEDAPAAIKDDDEEYIDVETGTDKESSSDVSFEEEKSVDEATDTVTSELEYEVVPETVTEEDE